MYVGLSPQYLQSVVAQLVNVAGVAESDICVFDASRWSVFNAHTARHGPARSRFICQHMPTRTSQKSDPFHARFVLTQNHTNRRIGQRQTN